MAGAAQGIYREARPSDAPKSTDSSPELAPPLHYVMKWGTRTSGRLPREEGAWCVRVGRKARRGSFLRWESGAESATVRVPCPLLVLRRGRRDPNRHFLLLLNPTSSTVTVVVSGRSWREKGRCPPLLSCGRLGRAAESTDVVITHRAGTHRTAAHEKGASVRGKRKVRQFRPWIAFCAFFGPTGRKAPS